MFIAVLFTMAKIWKQPKCPSVDKWIKKSYGTFIQRNAQWYLKKKEEGNPTCCDSMDRPGQYYAQ